MKSEHPPTERSGHADEFHADIVELMPLIRRVVRARIRDPHLAEDLVQETLARLIEARPRISRNGLNGYAVATARNLAHSAGRDQRRHRRHEHKLLDPREAPDPQEETLRQEENAAVSTALSKLSPREKASIVAHEIKGQPTTSLATEQGSTPGGVAVQLARARAKLRVDYLLALEKTQPPSPLCRRVLVALSAGDSRRQVALNAGDHLLHCDHCAALSEPLMKRRRPLAALWPLGPFVRLGEVLKGKFQTPKAQVGAATAGGAAVVGAVVLVTALMGGEPRPQPPSSPRGHLVIASGPVLDPSADLLAPHVGKRVTARSVVVQSVPADEGFWLGRRGGRVFVRLKGKDESPLKIRAGKRVIFSGRVVSHGVGFAQRVGVTSRLDDHDLRSKRWHIDVPYKSLRLP